MFEPIPLREKDLPPGPPPRIEIHATPREYFIFSVGAALILIGFYFLVR
jgi:hypothetical protein